MHRPPQSFTSLVASAAMILAAQTAASAPPAPMASYWPHDDLKLWVYEQHYVDYTTNSTEDAIARLWFDGTTVAPTAIQASLFARS